MLTLATEQPLSWVWAGKVVLELPFWQPLIRKWQWGDLSREESARAGISHQAVIPDRAWHGEHYSMVLL